MEYDIDSLVSGLDFNSGFFVKVNDRVQLPNREIEILNLYKINYQNCKDLKEIIFMIEDVLDDMDVIDDELELVSQSIAERDYYQNTNK